MKVAVLGNADSWYVDQICCSLEKAGHFGRAFGFSDLAASSSDGRCCLTIGESSVTEFDAVIVRTMPPGSLEQVVLRMNLLAVAEQMGVLVLNPAKAIECAVDKGLTTLRLTQAGLSVPDTAICETTDRAMESFDLLGRDVVVKPVFGAEGRGILRITDEQLAWRTFRTLERLQAAIYLQTFVQGPAEDLRVLVLDGRVVASMKRFAAPGDFRANAAQQGTALAWNATEEESSTAIRAARATGCIFAGVDLMYDQSQKLHVIEVNAVPGWKTLEKHCRVDVPAILSTWIQQQRNRA